MKNEKLEVKKIDGGICAPNGFIASGIHAGIKKKKRDLTLIVSDVPALSAGVFTTSLTKAACVTLNQQQLTKSKYCSAILVNSGNANACTGKRGMDDALQSIKTTARALRIPPSHVLVSSTGVIGQFLPMKQVNEGIVAASAQLRKGGNVEAAEGICTTDTFIKEYAIEVIIGAIPVRIGGIAKGSGMIAPNMATMLAFLTTDVNISRSLLKKTLLRATSMSFNRITVDGDTSTNDMVLVLANKKAANACPVGTFSIIQPFL